MTTAGRIPADRGLTTRMFLTGLFLVILYAAFGGIIWAFLHNFVLLFVIIFGLLFAQYWFSDKIALWGMHGKIVTAEQAPQLHGAVDRLCALADMPKPRVAIADTDMPNAFATGRSPKAAVVCATTGLMRRLDEPELEAVLAHELSHVAHRDVAIMTIASSLGVLAGLMTRVMLYATMFGGGGRGGRTQSGGQLVLMEMAVMLVSIVVYAISYLLTMALSRYRELAADRSGALLIGRPSLLAAALVKVSGEMARIPTRDLRRAEAFNAFFFTPAMTHRPGPGQQPGQGSGFTLSALFSTHPSLERRLDQLSQLEAQLGQPH
ncbi:MAG TPA: zinc metalloprotease HtpX [Acidimicrobiales bacterium]|nr:zinc metalloprotease HtpX [Acidimicrobiales bacterium]